LEQFILYSKNDSICLFNALWEAQGIYIKEYCVDVTKTYSTSSLSMRIFRQAFLNVPIPILKNTQDFFIRKSYLGGATDFFKAYAKKVYYYDVNSLYPYVMCKPMPYQIIKHHPQINSLEDFFGFCLAEIYCPDHIKPMLPLRQGDKTIFPTGR
jgi:hypothetical protein